MKIEIELDDWDWDNFKTLKKLLYGRRHSYKWALDEFVKTRVFEELAELEDKPDPPKPRVRRQMQLSKPKKYSA